MSPHVQGQQSGNGIICLQMLTLPIESKGPSPSSYRRSMNVSFWSSRRTRPDCAAGRHQVTWPRPNERPLSRRAKLLEIVDEYGQTFARMWCGWWLRKRYIIHILQLEISVCEHATGSVWTPSDVLPGVTTTSLVLGVGLAQTVRHQ